MRHWVAEGWGVAALAGRQTRRHRDLDLAVDADGLGSCLTALGRLGYAAETDWLPVRIELRAPGERWVDVHPVAFDANGHGRQAGLNDESFDYPPDAFARGTVDGRDVPCLSVRQQRRFRTGYEHRPQDIHDLAQLDALQDPEAKTGSGPGQPPGRHHHLEADVASPAPPGEPGRSTATSPPPYTTVEVRLRKRHDAWREIG